MPVTDPQFGFPQPIADVVSSVGAERSISVPFRFDFDGSVATVEGRRNIVRQEVLTLILTYIGERVMRPTYGSHISEYLWQSNDEHLVAVFLEELRELVSTNFPGVYIFNLGVVDENHNDDSELKIQLDYIYDDTTEQIIVNTADVLMEN